MSRGNDRDTLKGYYSISRNSTFLYHPITLALLFSANCSNNSFLLIQCAFTFYPWKTFNWFSIAPQHLLTTSLKRPAEPIYNPPLPSVSPRILGNVHDNFAYKNSDLQVHRFIITLLLERVCNRRPLLRSFERYACIFTRTGWISLRFTLFPQRYRFFFFSSQQSFSFSFFFFFFNFLYYYPPLCDIASSSQIVVDSRKLFIHFLSIAL